MSDRALSAVVLAAGDGTRMRSSRPKPLHRLCGRPMLLYVLDSLADCSVGRVVVVVGHGAERVTKKLQSEEPDLLLDFVEQHRQRGTGDAASVGLTAFPDDDARRRRATTCSSCRATRRCCGPTTIAALVDAHRASRRGLHRAHRPPRRPRPATAGSCGARTTRSSGSSSRPTPRPTSWRSTRSTPSIYCFRRSLLAPGAASGQPRERAGRVLPDRRRRRAPRRRLPGVGALDRRRGRGRAASTTGCSWRPRRPSCGAARTSAGCAPGVTMVDPAAPTSTPRSQLAPDVTLFPGTILQGQTVVGERCEIGPDTRLVDCMVGADAVVEQSNCRDAEIGAGAVVGPYAVLGPGSSVPDGTVTGPFYAARGRRPTERSRSHRPPARTGTARRTSTRDGSMEAGHQEEAPALHRATAHPELAQEIAEHLGVSLGAAEPAARSPTARCTAATASRSAARTSSSSRPTPARASTTRSCSS